jgi:hypothetical protein
MTRILLATESSIRAAKSRKPVVAVIVAKPEAPKPIILANAIQTVEFTPNNTTRTVLVTTTSGKEGFSKVTLPTIKARARYAELKALGYVSW